MRCRIDDVRKMTNGHLKDNENYPKLAQKEMEIDIVSRVMSREEKFIKNLKNRVVTNSPLKFFTQFSYIRIDEQILR